MIHMTAEFGALVVIVPLMIYLYFTLRLTLFQRMVLVCIVVCSVIVDGYLLVMWGKAENVDAKQ